MNKQLKEKLEKLTLCGDCGVSIPKNDMWEKDKKIEFVYLKSEYGNVFVDIKLGKQYCPECLGRIKIKFNSILLKELTPYWDKKN